ncbi:unnamed protein product [Oikopleura dioica]|uniref:Phospholipase A2-like central domain-containing protein n=1 Tax=Oikopleura dioica TaxID=34765 RepID=E4XTT5_OIKDI|nr:unnamed protein product [Oikopleura dioica]
MKFQTTIFSLVSSTSMEAWMEHYNPSFDKRDLYYMGKGRPVDEIDSVCLKYKQCLKCARNEFSDSCMNEFVFYGVAMNGNQPQCTDEAGTCGRKLCDCDKEFAKTVVDEMPVHNFGYHYFNTDFDRESVCREGDGTGTSDMQCCGTASSFSVLYNANAQQCCADGQVKDFGEIC